ncbi:site-specific tyrosine recombinase XerC [compost metagenome]
MNRTWLCAAADSSPLPFRYESSSAWQVSADDMQQRQEYHGGGFKCRTHSMRRTKTTLIYRRTKNLRAVQILLGHTKLESTVRYLGIEVEDSLEISEQTEL